jgi:hypothetical protein
VYPGKGGGTNSSDATANSSEAAGTVKDRQGDAEGVEEAEAEAEPKKEEEEEEAEIEGSVAGEWTSQHRECLISPVLCFKALRFESHGWRMIAMHRRRGETVRVCTRAAGDLGRPVQGRSSSDLRPHERCCSCSPSLLPCAAPRSDAARSIMIRIIESLNPCCRSTAVAWSSSSSCSGTACCVARRKLLTGSATDLGTAIEGSIDGNLCTSVCKAEVKCPAVTIRCYFVRRRCYGVRH